MISIIYSRLAILSFGTLYPAYYSFKAVRAKSVEEYLTWMMYWIVFAIFTAGETFTDIFLKWLPFYYELKILLIVWLLPSMGNGSPLIYRNCIHPFLKKHELRIDNTLMQMKHRGQDMIFHYVSEAALYLGRAIMKIVNKNVPNGVMGLMAAHSANDARVIHPDVPRLIIEEEVDEAPTTTAKETKRKATARSSAAKAVVEERGRVKRKGRPAKTDMDLDINLNES